MGGGNKEVPSDRDRDRDRDMFRMIEIETSKKAKIGIQRIAEKEKI